jgi:peptidoglycan/LPS O-acetylase OafA/YrhL
VPSTPDRSTRIACLEVIRGLAAMLVVVHHVASTNFAGYRAAARYVDPGRVGVVAFFVVSGYVIALSLEHSSVPDFAARRFFRLFPVYWVALAAFVCVSPTVLPGHSAQSPSAALFGLNVLMLSGFVGSLSILGPAWTLTIELVLYAQAAGAKARGRLDRSVHLGWFWLACYLGCCVVKHIGQTELPRSLPLFLYLAALGQSLYLRDRRDSAAPRLWLYLLAAGAIGVPLGAQLGVDPAWGPLNYDLSTLVGVAFFGIFYAGRALRYPRMLLWLGSISYAVYLFHPVLLEALERAGISRWRELALALVAVPLVSWAVHRGVERPCIALGRRVVRRRATRTVPAVADQPTDQPAATSVETAVAA